MTSTQVPVASSDVDTGTNGAICAKQLYCTSFQTSGPYECNSTIDDAVGIMWCQCCNQCYHMTPTPVSGVSYDADTGTNGIKWPNKLFCTLFYCLDLWNTIVQLMMPLVSCDADSSASGVTWH